MQGQVNKDMSPEENAIYESVIKEVIPEKNELHSWTFLVFVLNVITDGSTYKIFWCMPPYGHIHFHQKAPVSEVNTPPKWVHAPLGKSWIHPW